MKFYTFLALSLLFLAGSADALIINEVVPNPVNRNNEWVELYNPENADMNFSLWLIGDDEETDEITCHTIENCSLETNETYILIIGRGANISDITNESVTYFYVDDMRIGNSLSNTGDNVSLYNSTGPVDNVVYPPFSDKKGYSWARDEKGNWSYCILPTPGKPNIFTNTSENETEENQTEIDNVCDLHLWIKCNSTFGLESNKYYPMVEDLRGGSFRPEVEYWIEDMFGNIVRPKRRTNNTNVAKSWKPPEIKGTEAYVIRAVITNIVCNDTNISNNRAEKIIIVKGNEPYSECVCETKIVEKPCSCSPCPKCISREEKNKRHEEFEILSYPVSVRIGEDITVELRIRNPFSHDRNYTVYSYAYSRNKPISLGFDGNRWLSGWDANKEEISLSPNSSIILELKNRIANATEPGKYKLRVRILCNGKKHDITRDIIVNEGIVVPETPENKTENKTSEYETTEKHDFERHDRTPTGRVISSGDNWFSAFVENVINFFKNLLSL